MLDQLRTEDSKWMMGNESRQEEDKWKESNTRVEETQDEIE